MEFNPDKCEVLHIGVSHQGRACTVNDYALENVEEQRDLRIQVHGSLKMVSKMNSVTMKAFGTLVFIRVDIKYKGCFIVMQLYDSLVKPCLEYCMFLW